MAFAVGASTGATALVIVQAALLASVIDKAVRHRVAVGSLTSSLVELGLAFLGRAALLGAADLLAQRSSTRVTGALRTKILGHALVLGPSWLATERTGELSLTATRGVEALGVYFGRYLPQAVLAAMTPAAIVVWIATQDWASAILLLAMTAVVPVAMVAFGREATKRSARQWRRLSSLSARYLELIQGLPTLRAFGRAAYGRREVAASTEGLRQTTMGTLRVAFLSALAMELIAGLGVGLVAMVLGLRLLDGSLHLSTALAVLLVAPEVFVPLRRAGSEFHASTEGHAAGVRISEVLEHPAGAPDSAARVSGAPRTRPSPPFKRNAVAAPDPSSARLSVQQLTITYPGRPTPAVSAASVDVDAGEHLLVTGPSGSGKSTLLSAILGFVTPSSGKIVVGGIDLHIIDREAWRRRISWVPQDPHLFRGTIRDNVRLGQARAPAPAVDHAVAVSGLEPLVRRLPSGLDTLVGEKGLTLSAGERQRISLARAVLRDAPLVLLDEPASHLHHHAVEQLRADLCAWTEGRTVIVAAHRNELVRIDRVLNLGAALDESVTALGRGAG